MNGMNDLNVAQMRQHYCDAWNETMLTIWQERIYKLGIYDTGALMRSPLTLKYVKDSDYTELEFEYGFLEYGIWQDLGVGRETPRGNPGDIGRDKVRQRRRWLSTPFYSSVMNLKDFMADSIGLDFIGLVTNALSDDGLRNLARY